MLTLPLFEDTLASGYISDTLFLLFLAAAAYAVKRNRFFRWAMVLGVMSLAGVVACFFLHDLYTLLITGSIYLLYLALVIVLIVADLARDPRITTDNVLGGLCVYILIGVFWAILFAILEAVAPGSFSFGVHGTKPDMINTSSLLYYYSFVTLMTIGFGDVLPMSHMAQTLSVLEALIGQFYLVFFMASLVGRYVVQQRRQE
jgi:hypothetical protein